MNECKMMRVQEKRRHKAFQREAFKKGELVFFELMVQMKSGKE